ncbi:MAG TPA: DUF1499 domain-containing protein [Vicinamibacterales bacterium]|nr:DUF1499 domain-containing protein [Vicinamibacterales bacterium]
MIKTGLALSLIGAALLLAGPLGSRFGLWSFVIGFLMLALSLLLGLVGASLSLVAGFKTGQWQMAAAGIVAGLAVVSVPSAFILSGVGKPPIHDITTDTLNPPPFVAVLPLRAGAPNPPEYAGGAAADQQRRAYPDIAPLVVHLSASAAFDRVDAAVRDLGWELVGSDRTSGRIEATDTTFWFGFKDDVVVRITEDSGQGSRIDVRSKSRVGVGDLGTNARRVRELLSRLRS